MCFTVFCSLNFVTLVEAYDMGLALKPAIFQLPLILTIILQILKSNFSRRLLVLVHQVLEGVEHL